MGKWTCCDDASVSDGVEVSTVVYISAAEAYAFIHDFPRYANYSKYLQEVRQQGDGDIGTEYELEFEWWKLRYVARSEVTATDPPNGLSWEIVKDLDANGDWTVEPIASTELPDGREEAVRIRLRVDFRPGSADRSAIDLPRFVSLSWVIEKVKPLIQDEAERVVERIVRDLEGESREVTLDISRTSA
jgi:hypothetical protein